MLELFKQMQLSLWKAKAFVMDRSYTGSTIWLQKQVRVSLGLWRSERVSTCALRQRESPIAAAGR